MIEILVDAFLRLIETKEELPQKELVMLTTLFSQFKNTQIGKSYIQTSMNLVQHFEAEFVADGNAKDALIDDMCSYLQSLKTSQTSASTQSAD